MGKSSVLPRFSTEAWHRRCVANLPGRIRGTVIGTGLQGPRSGRGKSSALPRFRRRRGSVRYVANLPRRFEANCNRRWIKRSVPPDGEVLRFATVSTEAWLRRYVANLPRRFDRELLYSALVQGPCSPDGEVVRFATVFDGGLAPSLRRRISPGRFERPVIGTGIAGPRFRTGKSSALPPVSTEAWLRRYVAILPRRFERTVIGAGLKGVRDSGRGKSSAFATVVSTEAWHRRLRKRIFPRRFEEL